MVINPVIVDGQVRGGVTQGVAAALLERVCYDADGQPVSATLMDYLAPTAAEMCPVDIVHLETPSAVQRDRRQGHGGGRHDRRPGRRPQRRQRRAVRHRDRASTTSRCCRTSVSAALSEVAAMKDMHAIRLTRQRPGARAGRGGPPDAGRHAPPRPRLHRHPPRLRARHLRRLHGAGGRRAGPGLPGVRGAGRRDRGPHGGGAGRRGAAVRPAAGVQRSARAAVRVLHARLPHARRGLPGRDRPADAALDGGARPASSSRRTCAGAPATRASSRPSWPPRGPGGDRQAHDRHRHPAAARRRTRACCAAAAGSATTSAPRASCGPGSSAPRPRTARSARSTSPRPGTSRASPPSSPRTTCRGTWSSRSGSPSPAPT